MSIATEITRLQGAKDALKTAIEGKGVQVPSSALIDAYPALVDQIQQGGGEDEGVEKKDINFYDIDGKRLYSYTLAEARALTALPALPDHTGDFVPLTSQGWNWSLADIQSTDIDRAEVGVVCVPTDGDTHVVMEFPRDGVEMCLIVDMNDGATIDWGDGTEPVTTQISAGAKVLLHTYERAGEYDIIVKPVTGGICLGNGTTGVFGYNNGGKYRELFSFCKAVHLGARQKAGQSSVLDYITRRGFILTMPNETPRMPRVFYSGMTALICPNNAVFTGSSFQYSFYLKTLSLPSVVAAFANQIFDYSTIVENFALPRVLPVGTNVIFRTNSAFHFLYIPEGYTTLPNQAFQGCVNLFEIHLPSTITSIGPQCFESTVRMTRKIYCKATTPPTLGSYNNFNGAEAVYVPYSDDHSIINAYKSATNWSAMASIMVEYNF